MNEDLKYKYYCAYLYAKGNQQGIGSMFLSRDRMINTQFDIEAAQDYIMQEIEKDAVILLSFVLLDGEKKEENG